MTTAWTAGHVRRIDPEQLERIPAVASADRSSLDPARLYWDMWPVQDPSGLGTKIAGRELWMALTAPDRGDAELRHFEAKIHLLERRDMVWRDLGPLWPDTPVPYEREWAGSTLLEGDVLTVFFTAAGKAHRPGGYQQELWEARARLDADGLPGEWSAPMRAIEGYGLHYMPADAYAGAPGKIKAFRDPAYFRDPADGAEYLAFSASLAGSESPFNGAFGLACKAQNGWQLTAPLIHADGVNNELERAHLVFHRDRYYAFWSTQSSTFAPQLRFAPGGLYGMVSSSLRGPWRPLNGSGLVCANPAERPQQTYSWFVDASLTVCSFVNILADGSFGGVPAPLMRLQLDGERAVIQPLEVPGAP